MINGILIEGVDYSGKTSVAKSLVTTLNSNGIRAEYRHGYLSRGTRLNTLLTELSVSQATSSRKDLLNLTMVLLDDVLRGQLNDSSTFIVQDRQWFTALSRQLFYHQDNCNISRLLHSLQYTFKNNVYLRTDTLTKRLRSQGRAPTSLRDHYLVNNPQVHQDFDEFNVEYIKTHFSNMSIIDTSNRSIRNVTDEILEELEIDTAHCI